MERIVNITWVLAVSLLTLVSCNREQLPVDFDEVAQGTLNLSSFQVEVAVDNETPTRATEVMLDNFIVKILADKPSGSEEIRSWKYSEMPELFTMPVGNYRIEVSSSLEETLATFETGFWSGDQAFVIKENTVTEVASLFCQFRSIKVAVVYDPKLKDLLGDDVMVTVSVDNGGSLDYSLTEERAGYFKAVSSEHNLLKAHFVGTVEGVKQDFVQGFPKVKPGEFRAVTFTLKGVNDGSLTTGGTANVRLSIDANCQIIEEGVTVNPGREDEIEDFPSQGGNPDPSDPVDGAPTIIGKSFNGQPFDIRGKYEISGPCEVKVEIKAKEGMASVQVKIDSESLTPDILSEVGLSDSFDLAHPGSLGQGLEALGFPTGDQVIGQNTLLFDITSFTQLLGIYGPATHKFIIEVTDQKGGHVKETLTLISVNK